MDIAQAASPQSDRINKLKQERVALQTKTFTKWANVHLEKRNMKVEDLFRDFSDGRLLAELVECVGGQRVHIEHHPHRHDGFRRVHKMENVARVLDFLKVCVRLLDPCCYDTSSTLSVCNEILILSGIRFISCYAKS